MYHLCACVCSRIHRMHVHRTRWASSSLFLPPPPSLAPRLPRRLCCKHACIALLLAGEEFVYTHPPRAVASNAMGVALFMGAKHEEAEAALVTAQRHTDELTRQGLVNDAYTDVGGVLWVQKRKKEAAAKAAISELRKNK